MASIETTPSTPPPPSRLRSPPTPKHGAFSDDWEPFSPRKSVRISAKKASIARTPSPSSLRQTLHKSQYQSSRIVNKPTSSSSAFIMGSPASSPMKKRGRSTSGTALVVQAPGESADPGLKPVCRPAPGMLPTPSKTPSTKRHCVASDTSIQSIARNIFRPTQDDLAPSSKKRRTKQYQGIGLESFTAAEVEKDIKIHVDSRDRIPETDCSIDNPFNSERVRHGATNTRSYSKRAFINIPGEGSKPIDEALRRDDGIVYIFRGKAKFRKFKNVDGSSEGAFFSPGEVSPSRPITRSSITPRLLFPSKPMTLLVDEDEEALTDIEEDSTADAKAHVEPAKPIATPTDMVNNYPVTPKAPRFAPASPPTTGRSVKSIPTAVKATRGARSNPFHGWRMTKNGAQGQKRRAESSSEEGIPKKSRV